MHPCPVYQRDAAGSFPLCGCENFPWHLASATLAVAFKDLFAFGSRFICEVLDAHLPWFDDAQTVARRRERTHLSVSVAQSWGSRGLNPGKHIYLDGFESTLRAQGPLDANRITRVHFSAREHD